MIWHIRAVVLMAIASVPAFPWAQERQLPLQLQQQLLSPICENGAVAASAPGRGLQCATCPSYTNDGLERKGRFGPILFYLHGHFSEAHTEQILVTLYGCEDHPHGFGGTVLLGRVQDDWKRLAYFQGFRPEACISIPGRDGLDRLACQSSDGMGGWKEQWVDAISFQDKQRDGERLLEDISSNAGAASPEAGYCYDQAIRSFQPLRGRLGFSLVITQTRGPVIAGESYCSRGGRETPPTATWEQEETVRLEFLFDGDRFRLAPQSMTGLLKVQRFQHTRTTR